MTILTPLDRPPDYRSATGSTFRRLADNCTTLAEGRRTLRALGALIEHSRAYDAELRALIAALRPPR